MNRKKFSFSRRNAVIVAILALASVGIGSFAYAETNGTAQPRISQPTIGLNAAGQEFFCIDNAAPHTMHVNPALNNAACPAGTKGLNYPVSGAAVSKAVAPLLPAPATLSWGRGDIGEPATPLEHIGGPIRTNGTDMGEFTNVDPGVYQLFINSSFTRTAAASASDSDTYPVMTAWRQDASNPTWNADFSNTVITINGGRMSRGKTIDQTVNGSALITIHATTDVIHFVAFAYDEDAGSSGAVQVDSGSYSIVQLDSNPLHGSN